MRGNIKFVDAKTGKWGFIVPEDGGEDIHFTLTDCIGQRPSVRDGGLEVEFELDLDNGERHARSVKLVNPPSIVDQGDILEKPGEALLRWAFVPFVRFTDRRGHEYSSALEYLAEIVLEEKWFFGQSPKRGNPHVILKNYLTYTFYKLQKEEKITESRKWAAFNTGLVDRLYDPIYALFSRNNRIDPPWKFYDFCVPGNGSSGTCLTANFSPLPEAAQYFSSNFDMLLDTNQKIFWDPPHVIYKGVERDRFPQEFLEGHRPRKFEFQDYSQMSRNDRTMFLQQLSDAIKADLQCTRSIKDRLDAAKALAEKRTRWNFKTAIPQYYPTLDTMSLLLPLALVNDEVVDVAFVVTRNDNGTYQGRTVLPLDWAYSNARLVCRPDSDWLTTEMVDMNMADVSEENSGKASAANESPTAASDM